MIFSGSENGVDVGLSANWRFVALDFAVASAGRSFEHSHSQVVIISLYNWLDTVLLEIR